jgi:hypothetical protein
MSSSIVSAVFGGIVAVLLTSGLSQIKEARSAIFVLIAEFEINKKYKEEIGKVGISDRGYKTFSNSGGYKFISEETFKEVLEFYFHSYLYIFFCQSARKDISSEHAVGPVSREDEHKKYISNFNYDEMINKLKTEATTWGIIKNYKKHLLSKSQKKK